MKAIQYSHLGGPEVLELKELPDPRPKRGEAVVKICASAMNHLDLHFRKGLPGMKSPLPHIPGSDGAGIVDSVGEGVENIHIGDRVVVNPGISCGRCERCRAGEKSFCHAYQVIGRETDGLQTELAVVPAENLIPIPPAVSFETAAAAPLVYLTAWSMVVTKGQVKPGDVVVVTAAGSGVSMAIIQIAKLMGAKVIAATGSEWKFDRIKKDLGVETIIHTPKQELDREVRKITNRRGADVVFDHVGGDLWLPVLRATRNGGTVVTCGATAGFEPKEDLRQIFYRQVRVLGSTMGNDAELAAVMKLVFAGELRPIIDRTFTFGQIQEAHRRMENQEAFGKILLVP